MRRTKQRSTTGAGVTIPGHDDGARVSPEQAAAMVKDWSLDWLNDDEPIGDFLLLLRSIAFARDLDEREAVLLAIENTLAPLCVGVDAAMNSLLAQRLDVARTGAQA